MNSSILTVESHEPCLFLNSYTAQDSVKYIQKVTDAALDFIDGSNHSEGHHCSTGQAVVKGRTGEAIQAGFMGDGCALVIFLNWFYVTLQKTIALFERR